MMQGVTSNLLKSWRPRAILLKPTSSVCPSVSCVMCPWLGDFRLAPPSSVLIPPTVHGLTEPLLAAWVHTDLFPQVYNLVLPERFLCSLVFPVGSWSSCCGHDLLHRPPPPSSLFPPSLYWSLGSNLEEWKESLMAATGYNQSWFQYSLNFLLLAKPLKLTIFFLFETDSHSVA